MLRYLTKDVTTVEQGIIVQGVNCKGVMNSGVARAIRNKWPIVFSTYDKLCEQDPTPADFLGTAQIVRINDAPLYVANCFTQVSYGKTGRHADLNAIEQSLDFVCGWSHYHGNYPIYMPQIGSGLGGLSWTDEVEPVIKRLAEYWSMIDFYVCTLEH